MGDFYTTQKKWVLLVDDETALVSALVERLTKEGYHALSCDRASMAIQMLRNQKFDCILLDLKLEQGSGDQIALALRSDKAHPNHKTPIIVISGHLDRGTVELLKDGIAGALVKPFTREELLAKIAVVTEKKPVMASKVIGSKGLVGKKR